MAATNFAAWWTEARWVWTVCLRLHYPTASRLRFEPRSFCAWVQHANHSATSYRIVSLMSVCLRVGDRERRVCVQAAGDPAAPHRSHVRDRSVDSTCVARHRLRRHRPRTQRAYDAIPDMDVGPFFFTQPNPPITYLREMQTPVLQNPSFYMSVDEIDSSFWLWLTDCQVAVNTPTHCTPNSSPTLAQLSSVKQL